MFELATFAIGSVLLGIVVTLIAAIVLLLCVPFLFGKQHSPISYATTVLFTLVLLVLNITFAGLVNSKQKLIDYQNSYEYKLVQRGSDMLEQISPDVAGLVTELFSTEGTTADIEYQINRINKYLWIDGILCVILFVLGITLVNVAAGSQRYNGTKRGSSGRTVRKIPTHDDF